MTARAATSKLLSSKPVSPIPIFPDLAHIFTFFAGAETEPILEQPPVLLDSLLALIILSMEDIGQLPHEDDFDRFVLILTTCTSRHTYSSIRRLPTSLIHSHPSQDTRFKLIRKFLENEEVQHIKDSAIGWLKHEILEAAKSNETSIFLNLHYFMVIMPSLFSGIEPPDSDIVASWVQFAQISAPSIHAALGLFYILLSSQNLRQQLQLEKTYPYLRKALDPIKSTCHAFETDMTQNGGDGKIEAAVGEEICQVGMARSVRLISLVLSQIEDITREVFRPAELAQITEDDASAIQTVDDRTRNV